MNSLLVTESSPKILASLLSYCQRLVTVSLANFDVNDALLTSVALAFS